MDFALNLAVDFNQALCGDVPYNFQSLSDDCATLF